MTENQNKKKSRPSRLRLYFAPALLLALSLALSVGWVMISHRVEAHLDRMIADEASKGRLWTCANRNIAGFPFRIEIECLDAQVKVANEPHFDVKLPRIIAVAQIYDPRLVIIEAQGPLSIVASDKPAVSASWSSLRSSIHMQSDQMPDRLSIVGDSLTLKNEMRGQSVAITHGELHIRVKPNDDKPSNDLEFALRAQGLSSDLVPGTPAIFETSGAIEQGVYFLTFKGPETIETWRRANGRLDLETFTISRGDQMLNLKGQIGLDEQRRATGQIEFTGKGLDEFFKTAGLSKLSTLQTTNLKVPLVFTNGSILLGPFKMAELKPLY